MAARNLIKKVAIKYRDESEHRGGSTEWLERPKSAKDYRKYADSGLISERKIVLDAERFLGGHVKNGGGYKNALTAAIKKKTGVRLKAGEWSKSAREDPDIDRIDVYYDDDEKETLWGSKANGGFTGESHEALSEKYYTANDLELFFEGSPKLKDRDEIVGVGNSLWKETERRAKNAKVPVSEWRSRVIRKMDAQERPDGEASRAGPISYGNVGPYAPGQKPPKEKPITQKEVEGQLRLVQNMLEREGSVRTAVVEQFAGGIGFPERKSRLAKRVMGLAIKQGVIEDIGGDAWALTESKERKETLYKGHYGPGIGNLAKLHPEKKDGDRDTVVNERRPRKTDKADISPVRQPGHIFKRINRERTASYLASDDPAFVSIGKEFLKMGDKETKEKIRTIASRLIKKRKASASSKASASKATSGIRKSGIGSLPGVTVRRR